MSKTHNLYLQEIVIIFKKTRSLRAKYFFYTQSYIKLFAYPWRKKDYFKISGILSTACMCINVFL